MMKNANFRSFFSKGVGCLLVSFVVSAVAGEGQSSVSPVNPATSPTGIWQTLDETTHLSSSLIAIKEHQGEWVGTVIQICHPTENHAVYRCDRCKDDRAHQPVIGMEVVRHMRYLKPGFYGKGTVLDPRNGHVYKAQMRLKEQGSQLDLRGYILMPWIGKTARWYRRSHC